MSRMRDNFLLLEVEVVEIRVNTVPPERLQHGTCDYIDIKKLKQEVEYLQRDREEMSKELQQTKDELREVKSTLGRQLADVRKEMQEDFSALKSVLHTKDELITNLKERLSSVSAPTESPAKPLIRPEMHMENPQPEQTPVIPDPQRCCTGPERNTRSYPD